MEFTTDLNPNLWDTTKILRQSGQAAIFCCFPTPTQRLKLYQCKTWTWKFMFTNNNTNRLTHILQNHPMTTNICKHFFAHWTIKFVTKGSKCFITKKYNYSIRGKADSCCCLKKERTQYDQTCSVGEFESLWCVQEQQIKMQDRK